MKRRGSAELDAAVIQKGRCIGCGACIHLCPYFRSYRGKTALLFQCTVGEGRCFAYCPKIEVDLDGISRFLHGKTYDGSPLGNYRKILVSRAGEKMKAGAFQAGGTVSALLDFALRRKVIPGAVVTGRQGLLPVPRFVTRPSDVVRHSLSKYAAAPTLGALNEALDKRYTGLGVVATPCQATAVAQMRMNPLKEPDFQDPAGLVIGLFCTWALDFRRFEDFLAGEVPLEEVVKIDIPPPPEEVLEVTLRTGTRVFPLERVRPLVPDTCGLCPDMTAEFADLSVGVLEGRKDWNTLIVRTERGEKIVTEAAARGYLILEEMPGENLEHLLWAAGNKKKRGFLRAREDGTVNGEPGKTVFRLAPDILEGILTDDRRTHVDSD